MPLLPHGGPRSGDEVGCGGGLVAGTAPSRAGGSVWVVDRPMGEAGQAAALKLILAHAGQAD
jgi:hypothetical protein